MDCGYYYTCNLCNRQLSDIGLNFLLRYERFDSIRQDLFEIILDTLWVGHSAILFNQDDLYLSGVDPD